jgi:hypothetical protein
VEETMLRTSLLASALVIGLLSAASAATMQYQATLSGKSSVPPKPGSGSGDALATLDTTTKKLTYTVTFQGLSGPATAAHFHGPAGPDANAGVVVPIGGKDPTSPVTGSATLTDAQMKELEDGKWYVNVHTAANPAGEIRGQVLPVKTAGSAAKPMNR